MDYAFKQSRKQSAGSSSAPLNLLSYDFTASNFTATEFSQGKKKKKSREVEPSSLPRGRVRKDTRCQYSCANLSLVMLALQWWPPLQTLDCSFSAQKTDSGVSWSSRLDREQGADIFVVLLKSQVLELFFWKFQRLLF